MIILDTHVISELMRATPATAVVHWANGRPATSLYLTSITQAEILHGIQILPRGKRRDALATAAAARPAPRRAASGRARPSAA